MPSPSAPTSGSSRHGLARRICLHTGLLTVACCVILSSLGYYWYRGSLLEHEKRAALIVHMSAVNYLAGHYRSHHNQYVAHTIDDELHHDFMIMQEEVLDAAGYRPSSLALYDREGQHRYDLKPERSEPDLPALTTMPDHFGVDFSADYSQLVSRGPIYAGREVIGYIVMRFDTDIPADLSHLMIRTSSMTGVVLAIGLLLSWVSARRSLNPIQELTDAAARIRVGDLQVRVTAPMSDELGLLADTFNEMAVSLSRRVALMHRMQEWTIRVAKEFDLGKLYDVLVDMFERMAQTTTCRLYITDEAGENLQLVRYRGGQGTLSLRGDAACRAAFDRNRPVFIHDGDLQRDHAEGALELALPLHTGLKKVGAVRIGRREDGQPYTEETLITLQTLTQLASVAVENTRLYRALSERARVEQEMQWARQIQQSMLPRTTPSLPGYEIYGLSVPALEVGGDYFDYVKGREGAWHVLIGDVSGKGVPAALIMSIVRSLIHTYSEFTDAPSEIFRHVNRSLSPDLEAGMFVTLADAQVDPVNHRVRIVRAGHEPILIQRASGEVERVEPRGSAVGLMDVDVFDRALEECEVRLDPGDTLLLYTDGLTETRDREGRELGYDGLAALVRKYSVVSAEELARAMAGEIKAFAGAQDPHDDFTMVVLRRSR